MAVEVTRAQVIAYRVAAQGLHRTASKAADLAVLDIGVQDSGSDAALLAFDARLKAAPRGTDVGPGRPLALVWSLRGAPYVHRRADLDALAGALWPLSEQDAVARLDAAASVRKAGIDASEAYATTVDALRNTVTKPMSKGAASAAVTKVVPKPLTRECRACKARHVFELPFRLGSLPAGLELEPGTAPPVLVPRAKSKRVEGPDVAALQALIVAYLTVLGPATKADVAGYVEARRADIESVWPSAGISEVHVEGRTCYLPSARVRALRSAKPRGIVRLIGGFDPYMQARDRQLIVPDKSVHKALWPILGRPGVVLADGEVAGTWRAKSSAARLTVTVDEFAPLPPSTWREIEAEAERVAAVRGARTVDVRRS